MRFIKKYIAALYLTNRFYLMLLLCIILFVISFFIPVIFTAVQMVLVIFILLTITDYIFVFVLGKPPDAKRIIADRLSNGDENTITLIVKNNLPFTVDMEIIDELPVQFQKRDWKKLFRIKKR